MGMDGGGVHAYLCRSLWIMVLQEWYGYWRHSITTIIQLHYRSMWVHIISSRIPRAQGTHAVRGHHMLMTFNSKFLMEISRAQLPHSKAFS